MYRRPGKAHSSSGEFGEESLNSAVDLVADRTNGLDALTGGVGEVPVEVALARIERALVTATHRDHDVGSLDRGVVKTLGVGAADVKIDADLGHGLDDCRVDRLGRRSTR